MRRIFAAPEGWTPPRSPNITFGVVSDTHLRTDRTGTKIDRRNWPDKYLVAAFRHFHDINVDLVHPEWRIAVKCHLGFSCGNP